MYLLGYKGHVYEWFRYRLVKSTTQPDGVCGVSLVGAGCNLRGAHLRCLMVRQQVLHRRNCQRAKGIILKVTGQIERRRRLASRNS